MAAREFPRAFPSGCFHGRTYRRRTSAILGCLLSGLWKTLRPACILVSLDGPSLGLWFRGFQTGFGFDLGRPKNLARLEGLWDLHHFAKMLCRRFLGAGAQVASLSVRALKAM